MIPLAVAVPIITSVLGGVGNAVFGGGRKKYSIGDLEQYGYKPIDEAKLKGDLARLVNSQLKSRRAGVEAKNNQMGIKDAKAVYSNEEDILNNQVAGEQKIEETKANQDNEIAKLLFQLNEGQPEEKGWGEKAFEGVLAGANIGTSIAKMLPAGNSSGTGTGTDTIIKGFKNLGNTVSNLKSGVKNANSLNAVTPNMSETAGSEDEMQFEKLLGQGWTIPELQSMGYKIPLKYLKGIANTINSF